MNDCAALGGAPIGAHTLPIRVADIEISRPLDDLLDLPGYRALRGIVRLHGTPLGYVNLPVRDGRCSAAALAAAVVAQQGDAILRALIHRALEAPLPVAPLPLLGLLSAPEQDVYPALPQVTVAVCTRDRPEELAGCLDALLLLDYPQLDLLVVDNAPRGSETERLVRSRYPAVRYVREPRPGLDWARNRAILEARSPIIAYTDDDVIVDPGWVRALAQRFTEDPDVMAVTGLVVPHELETEAQFLFEEYGGFGRGFTRSWHRVDTEAGARTSTRYKSAGVFGTGANMAFRRTLFDRIGYFDPALDVGTATHGGGDLEMFFRTLKEGYTLVREPRAMVRHRHRREYSQLRSQLWSWGVGMYSYAVRSCVAYPDECIGFARLAIRLVAFRNLRRFGESLLRERYPRELLRAELIGSFLAPLAYVRARRRAAEIERVFGPLLPTGRPRSTTVPCRTPARRRRRISRTVDVSQPLAPLTGVEDAMSVQVDVVWGDRRVGRIRIDNAGRLIGISQLRDAIARELADRLLPRFSVAGSRGGLANWCAALEYTLAASFRGEAEAAGRSVPGQAAPSEVHLLSDGVPSGEAATMQGVVKR